MITSWRFGRQTDAQQHVRRLAAFGADAHGAWARRHVGAVRDHVGGRGESVPLEALAGEARRHDDGVGRLEDVADPPAVHPPGDARRLDVDVGERFSG
jgi:hypothetical protein